MVHRSTNFDLDQAKLKEVYPGSSHTHAYRIIGAYLLKKGFKHVQGSGYVSNEPLYKADVTLLIRELIAKNLWLADCLKAITSTNVTKETDILVEAKLATQEIRANQTKSKTVNKKR